MTNDQRSGMDVLKDHPSFREPVVVVGTFKGWIGDGDDAQEVFIEVTDNGDANDQRRYDATLIGKGGSEINSADSFSVDSAIATLLMRV